MQSLRQYRDIGAYVEATHGQREWPQSRKDSEATLRSSISDGTGFFSTSSSDLEKQDDPSSLQQVRLLEHHEHDLVTPPTATPVRQSSTEIVDDFNLHCLSNKPDDPANPHTWPYSRRYWALFIIMCVVFSQAWAGSADSMNTSIAARELHVSSTAESLATGLYLVGQGVGSLFAGPLSETFGRNAIYLCPTVIYMFSVAETAMMNTFAGQIIGRFMVGFWSSATIATNGASVDDMFNARTRSWAFPILCAAGVLPSALAPVASGWIVEAGWNWHWADWITLLMSFPPWLAALLFLPETYSPLLLKWKAQHLRRVTHDDRYMSALETGGTLGQRLKEALPRPVIFLTREPVIIILGIYLMLLNVLIFTLQSGFEFLFTRTYGFSVGLTGSVFLAIAAGCIFSLILTPFFMNNENKTLRRRRRHDGPRAKLPPEMRLWPAIIAAPWLAISLFGLAWTNDPSISPWWGCASCFIFGYALLSILVSSYQYIMDSYGTYAASALGTISLLRFMVAAGVQVAARPMFESMGPKWALSAVGAVAVVLVPAPLIFWKYGEIVRARSRYAD
ncbi:major facilitator superfamily domain-containing protein [Phyllosticta citrichinensis]|uniref:Major facilitator superfamily domain-containing protein n=1 Tax=Phyllosticta citrichinensis TaxID=1130410 RepID=A0ABR1XIQ0_9PEZI